MLQSVPVLIQSVSRERKDTDARRSPFAVMSGSENFSSGRMVRDMSVIPAGIAFRGRGAVHKTARPARLPAKREGGRGMQHELTGSDLLDGAGMLAERGWARAEVKRYRRGGIRAP